jgi:hypothetical protein
MPVDLQSLLQGLNFDEPGPMQAMPGPQAPGGIPPALQQMLMQGGVGMGMNALQGNLLGGNQLARRQAQMAELMRGLNPPRLGPTGMKPRRSPAEIFASQLPNR